MTGLRHISVEVSDACMYLVVMLMYSAAPASNDQAISEIPDISDSPPLAAKGNPPSDAMGKLNLDDKGAEVKDEEIPDIDDIPDMDEAAGLEEEGDDAAVKIVHPSESVCHEVTVGA